MRIIYQGRKKAFAFELSLTRVEIHGAEDEAEPEEQFDHVPQDPHGTSYAQIERRPAYDYDTEVSVKAQRFGFGVQN